MKLQDIKYFEELLELNDEQAVADYYQVSLEMVNHGIQTLENEAGKPLLKFDASTHQFVLTSIGKKLHKRFKVILNQLQEIDYEIYPRKIKIGIPPLTEKVYFPNFAYEVIKDAIKNTEIVEGPTIKLIQKLSNHQIDLSFLGSIDSLEDANLNSLLIQKHKLQLIVNKNNPLAEKDCVKFSELVHEKFILMPSDYLQSKIFKRLSKNTDIFPQIIYRTSDISNAINMVKLNLGVTLLLADSVKHEKDLVSVKFNESEPVPELLIYLVWLKDHTLSNEEKKIVGLLEDAYQQ